MRTTSYDVITTFSSIYLSLQSNVATIFVGFASISSRSAFRSSRLPWNLSVGINGQHLNKNEMERALVELRHPVL